MADLTVPRIRTVEAMRDALRDGAVLRASVLVMAVRLDGAVTTDLPARAVAEQITYDVQPIDTSMFVDTDPRIFEQMTPHNRSLNRGRIFSAMPLDLMEVVVLPPELGGVRVDLYHKGTERPDRYKCNGEPLEPSGGGSG